jgi:hypothetical protein
MLTTQALVNYDIAVSHNTATLFSGEDGVDLENPVGGTDGQSMKEFRQSPHKC